MPGSPRTCAVDHAPPAGIIHPREGSRRGGGSVEEARIGMRRWRGVGGEATMGREETRWQGFLTSTLSLSLFAPAVPPLRRAPAALPPRCPTAPTVLPPRRFCHSLRAPTAPPLPPLPPSSYRPAAPAVLLPRAHGALSISLAMRIKREEKGTGI
uniref:Uncharacterized protein n=1 Tax=Oryza meridionalis TaxID=40149 RepID=A0A0E0C0M4_9ORYZ